MNILSIGTDRKIFEVGSAPRQRMIEYGTLFTELHIIIFAQKKLNLQPQKIADNVWIYPTNSTFKFLYPISARFVFRKYLKKFKPDVITTQDPFETGIAGWLIARKTKAKLQVQIHTDFESKYFVKNSPLNWLRVRIAHWLLPKAQAIRAVSSRIRSSLSRISPELPERTIVLPIYTDMEKFRNTVSNLDLHKKYPQFSCIILMASRINVEKNIGFALEILRELILKDPTVGLIIVGDGPDKRYLQGLVLKYHLDRNVVFEPWQKDLAPYYHSADVFLLTSLYEGYGLTLAEASAAGCPIVSSDVGVAPDVIEEGVNGFVCNIAKPETFIEKLSELALDQEKRKAVKASAVALAEKKSLQSKAEYLAAYKQAIEEALH